MIVYLSRDQEGRVETATVLGDCGCPQILTHDSMDAAVDYCHALGAEYQWRDDTALARFFQTDLGRAQAKRIIRTQAPGFYVKRHILPVVAVITAYILVGLAITWLVKVALGAG